MRVIFAGTPAFAAEALQAIIDAGHVIVLVLTQPDRPSGRGMKLKPSSVKALAEKHSIPVFQPERLKDPSTHEPIRAAAADVMVVAAYGLILPQAVLDLPRFGCLNIHASLLPRWRGAAPIHRAIEAGDRETGITVMQMEAGLDTGPMLLAQALPIRDDDTTGSLHDRLATLGGELIVSALETLGRGIDLTPTVQPTEGVTYAHKIEKTEAQLDWNSPADILQRKIRAFNPFPGATVTVAGEFIKVWQADVAIGVDCKDATAGDVLMQQGKDFVVACQGGALKLLEVQRPGGRRQSSAEFLRTKAAV